MGPPSGALRECQPGRPRVPYRRMSNSVHHAQACIGSTRDQRDPLQLAEHSGDAAGIVPAIADVPGRAFSDWLTMTILCIAVLRLFTGPFTDIIIHESRRDGRRHRTFIVER